MFVFDLGVFSLPRWLRGRAANVVVRMHSVPQVSVSELIDDDRVSGNVSLTVLNELESSKVHTTNWSNYLESKNP